jgi:agmatinase
MEEEKCIMEKVQAGVVSLGIPLDENSSFLRGPAQAPAMIRKTVHSGSSNMSTENGLDLSQSSNWAELEDLQLTTGEEAFSQIEAALDDLLKQDKRVLSLGGDHSITYPIIRAYAKKYPRLSILHLDAHPDLYAEFEGSRRSHACPFARIMEAGLASRLVQVGIRTMNSHQRDQAKRFGVEVIEMRQWTPGTAFEFNDPLYVSLDMDVFDPAFAPGVSHHEPGGFSSREVLNILYSAKAKLVGADIVEYNPTRDTNGITAALAAKFYKEILMRLLLDQSKQS